MSKNNLPRILVAGNCTVDLLFKSKAFLERRIKDRVSLAFGGKYLAEEFFQFYGGGGANASVSLAKQGFEVALWAHLGNDIFGREANNNLKKFRVKTKLIRFAARETPISAVLLAPGGDRTIITYRSDADLLSLNSKVINEMRKTNWFLLYSLPECPKEDKIQILKEAKCEGLKIFLSLHGNDYAKGHSYLKDFFSLADILHLNAYELADIFGGEAADFNFYKTNFAVKLNLPLLLVSWDKKGSFCYTKDKIYHQAAIPESKRVDTTGAGDAFSSGFLGKLLKTDSIPEALYFGARNATSVIEHLGAQNVLLS